jgi:hypothetical protein
MKTKLFLMVVLVAGITAGTAALAVAADTLGLGLCAPMTGGAASWGQKAEVGAKFAIERKQNLPSKGSMRGAGLCPKGKAVR